MDKRIIDTAIAAHNLWKSRLEEVVRTGKLDIPINKIILDDQCVFGKWLYGPSISIDEKSSHDYKKVKELHAEFHAIAAKVAELASTGKAAEAEDLMGISGDFAIISGKLNVAMMQWTENIRARKRN